MIHCLVAADGRRGLNYPVNLGWKKNITSLLYLQMPQKMEFSIVTLKWGYIMNVLWFSSFFLFVTLLSQTVVLIEDHYHLISLFLHSIPGSGRGHFAWRRD